MVEHLEAVDATRDAETIKSVIRFLKVMEEFHAVEVVHGSWVRLDAHKGVEQFKCSTCRSECYVPTCMNEPMYDYCPNCGAKMDLYALPNRECT